MFIIYNENETVSSGAKGPGLLDGDFLLEETSLGIAENNAEVVAAIAPSAEKVPTSQSLLCELLGEYVLVGTELPIAKMCMAHLLLFAHLWDV